MPIPVLVALLVVGVAVAVFGRPRSALIVLCIAWLLVPQGARVPGTGFSQLFLQRVVLLAVGAGLLLRIRNGTTDRAVLRLRNVHVALLGYVTVAALFGVLLAESSTYSNQNSNGWYGIAEQALIFAVAIALLREVGARRSVGVISGVAGVMAAVAIIEHVTGWSYGAWFSANLLDPDGLLRLPLQRRGPHERVRVAAGFALEFGWVAALLTPGALAWAVVVRRERAGPGRRRLPALAAWLVPAGLILAMVWSWSRSAYAGLAAGVLVAVLGYVLDRPRQLAVLTFGAFVVLAFAASGPMRETVDLGAVGGDQDVRFERLPEIIDAVAGRPFIGLGLGGLLARRVRVVDVSWVQTYATLGVGGLVALGTVLLTSVHAATRFVRSAPGSLRLIAAGAAGAVVAAPIGYGAYDLGTLRTSNLTVFVLVALALTANEELGVLPAESARARRPPALAVALGAVGLVIGIGAAVAVPERSSSTLVFTTVDPRVAAATPGDQRHTIGVLSKSGCVVAEAITSEARIECDDLYELAGGIGRVRIEAEDPATVAEARSAIAERLEESFPAATIQVAASGRGRPTWATTAPLWMAVVGVALGAIAPTRELDRAVPETTVRPPVASEPPPEDTGVAVGATAADVIAGGRPPGAAVGSAPPPPAPRPRLVLRSRPRD